MESEDEESNAPATGGHKGPYHPSAPPPPLRDPRPGPALQEKYGAPGLEATEFYSPPHASFASRVHGAIIEVDPSPCRFLPQLFKYLPLKNLPLSVILECNEWTSKETTTLKHQLKDFTTITLM